MTVMELLHKCGELQENCAKCPYMDICDVEFDKEIAAIEVGISPGALLKVLNKEIIPYKCDE